MLEIMISNLIDKDIRFEIEAFVKHKLSLIDKNINLKVSENKNKGILYTYTISKSIEPTEAIEVLIRTAKELLLIKIEGRRCYEKFKQHCKNGCIQ